MKLREPAVPAGGPLRSLLLGKYLLTGRPHAVSVVRLYFWLGKFLFTRPSPFAGRGRRTKDDPDRERQSCSPSAFFLPPGRWLLG